jgi:Sec-independent protein secretion pathway component TatC
MWVILLTGGMFFGYLVAKPFVVQWVTHKLQMRELAHQAALKQLAAHKAFENKIIREAFDE